MKTLMKCALLAGAAISGALMTGCTSTPAYSGDERGAQISHNISQEYQILADDTDYWLMLRPETTLTYWNIYHRN